MGILSLIVCRSSLLGMKLRGLIVVTWDPPEDSALVLLDFCLWEFCFSLVSPLWESCYSLASAREYVRRGRHTFSTAFSVFYSSFSSSPFFFAFFFIFLSISHSPPFPFLPYKLFPSLFLLLLFSTSLFSFSFFSFSLSLLPFFFWWNCLY